MITLKNSVSTAKMTLLTPLVVEAQQILPHISLVINVVLVTCWSSALKSNAVRLNHPDPLHS